MKSAKTRYTRRLSSSAGVGSTRSPQSHSPSMLMGLRKLAAYPELEILRVYDAYYRWLIVLFGVLLVGMPVEKCHGVSADEPANYAFGVYMGSGFYTAASSDSNLFLLALPYRTPFLPAYPDLHVRLAVATGFFNYDGEDVADLELPSSIDTFSFVPGFEYHFHFNPTFVIKPFVDVGYASNVSTGENAIMVGMGAVAEKQWGKGAVPHLWFNKLTYAEYETLEGTFHDEFGELMTGIDYRSNRYWSIGHQQWMPTVYSLLFYRYNDIDVLARLDNGYREDFTIEVGASLFAPKPFDLGFMEIDRIGLGYQEAPYGHVIHFLIGGLY